MEEQEIEKKESILFLCAHNDDQLVGAGGTIAKYSKEGKSVVTIIFSFGEASLPHLQEIESRKTRVKESKQAAKILGENSVHYLGLTEGKFLEEAENKQISKKLKKLISRIKPKRIFTHAPDDPHPDHRAVNKFTTDLIKDIKFKGDVYAFNVWNPFINLKKREMPRLVVDITDTLNTKVKAFKVHKSQIVSIIALMWSVYGQALYYGFLNHIKYAEVFYKIKVEDKQ